jgi:hypothetical protein
MVLSWWEAVAVTVEVAGQVRRSGGLLVTPDPGHVVVKPEGDVTILPGSPIPEHPVIQAARLMKGLLRETTAPPDLRDLVTQNLGLPPSCAWIEEFVAALSYFERPSPRQILRALAARATAMGSPATTKPAAKRALDRRLSRRST